MCTGEMVVVHHGFLRCSIEHEGGPVVTEGRVTEALQCSCFLLSLPGYPCPWILAMGISYHDGGNGSRSPLFYESQYHQPNLVLHLGPIHSHTLAPIRI